MTVVMENEPKKVGKLVILTLGSFASICLDSKKSTMLKVNIFYNSDNEFIGS